MRLKAVRDVPRKLPAVLGRRWENAGVMFGHVGSYYNEAFKGAQPLGHDLTALQRRFVGHRTPAAAMHAESSSWWPQPATQAPIPDFWPQLQQMWEAAVRSPAVCNGMDGLAAQPVEEVSSSPRDDRPHRGIVSIVKAAPRWLSVGGA